MQMDAQASNGSDSNAKRSIGKPDPPDKRKGIVVQEESYVEALLSEQQRTGQPQLNDEGDLREGDDEAAELKATIRALELKLSAVETELGNSIASLRRDQEQGRSSTVLNAKERLLPHDTFSFMSVASTCGIPFVLALLVFGFQMAVLALMTLDLLSKGEGRDNVFGIPGNVSPQLRSTQFLAILVAVFTQNDMVTGLSVFRDGYSEQFSETFIGASFWKYLLSLSTRILEGSVGLVVSFLLIVTAESVVDLLLNFTAIEFVSNLDEVIFILSKQGFVGKACKIEASIIAFTSYAVKKKHGRAWKMGLLLIILVSMLVGWAVVVHFQTSGRYLCKTIFVQFGDEFVPALGTFSGLYELRSPSYSAFSQRRVEYVERRSMQVRSTLAKFAFCDDISAWTFQWERSDVDGEADPCDWVARSTTTESFEITDTMSSEWFVRDAEMREVELNPFYLTCFDCQGNEECGAGSCDDAVCHCDEDRYGLRCEFAAPCKSISVDAQTDNFASARDWANDYKLFEDGHGFVESYHRPIYIHEYTSGALDVILYTGRRWALASSQAFLRGDSMSETNNATIAKGRMARFFRDEFHAYTQNITFAFLSESTDVGNPKDASSPIWLRWFTAKTTQDVVVQGPDRDINTRLLCQVCNDKDNLCFFDGSCINGTCQCSPGSYGDLCQVPPVGNGYCNSFFNTPAFKLDGGDCCGSTCVSNLKFICDDSTAYPFCQLPRDEWRAQGDPIIGNVFSRSGTSVAISRNGAILAVADAGPGRVRLFDKDGSLWVERAASPEVETTINAISVSTGPADLLNNPTFLAPIVVAVAGVQDEDYVALIFACELQGCHEMAQVDAVVSVDISADGSTIAFGFAYPAGVRVAHIDYKSSRILYNFEYSFPNSSFVPSVSLSGTGDILAAVSLEDTGEWWAVVGSATMVFKASALLFTRLNGSNYSQDAVVLADEEVGLSHADFGDVGAAISIYAKRPSIALSDNGKVAVYFLKNACQVFMRNSTRTDWTEQVLALYECNGDSNPRLAISEDGSVVAFRPTWGEPSAYVWNGAFYDQLGVPWNDAGSEFSSLALSGYGSVVAIGFPDDVINEAGVTRVHAIDRDRCPDGKTLLRIVFTPLTDLTRWELQSRIEGTVVMTGTEYSWGFSSSTKELCVANDDCLSFTVFPSDDYECIRAGADGDRVPPTLASHARYDLFLDSKHVSGGDFFDSTPERVYIGDCHTCPDGKTLLRVKVSNCVDAAWSLIDGSSRPVALSTETVSNGFTDSDKQCVAEGRCVFWETACLNTEEECYTFSVNETLQPGDDSTRKLAVWIEYLPPVEYDIILDSKKLASGRKDPYGPDGELFNQTHRLGKC